MSAAYYTHTGRRLNRPEVVLRKLWRHIPGILLAIMIVGVLSFAANEVFNPSRVAERAMLSNTRTFGVMCPTPGMTADQMVLWHAYAAKKNLPAYPEAGPNCYDP